MMRSSSLLIGQLAFACIAVLSSLSGQTAAQKVAYVLNTDSNSVPAEVQAAIFARMGAGTQIIPIGPTTNGATINGTPIRYLGDQTIFRYDPGSNSQIR